jgi:hypothetical protein
MISFQKMQLKYSVIARSIENFAAYHCKLQLHTLTFEIGNILIKHGLYFQKTLKNTLSFYTKFNAKHFSEFFFTVNAKSKTVQKLTNTVR